jgi:hypothetical protein
MSTKILYITEPTFNFNNIIQTSKLLCSPDADITDGEYHTSLGDLPATEIISLSQKFDEIHFCIDEFDINSDIYKETVFLLHVVNRYKSITNFAPLGPKEFTDIDVHSRRDEPTLWVFGCSHSAGVGLEKTDMRYGEIMSQQLNLPLKLIAKPGSSTQWSFRHLMSANINKHDTVVWQLTSPPRISIFDGTAVNEIMLSRTNNQHLLEIYNDNQIFFNQLTILNAGVKYLRSLGVKFVVTTYDVGPDIAYRNEYIQYPEYCYCPDFVVDFAPDGHFGHLSHKRLAHALLNYIQSSYE